MSVGAPARRRLLVVATLVVSAGATFAIVQLTRGTPREGTSFVARALGRTDASAALARSGAAGSVHRIDRGGVRVTAHGQSVGLRLATAHMNGSWSRHANGVERALPFGRETIVVERTSSEEFVTVDRRLGARTWSWQLLSSLRPVLQPDGTVLLQPTRGGVARLEILPVAIMDDAGHDVTPARARWSVAHRRGGTYLELRLDDVALPLPYVIDPSIALTGTCPNTAGQTDLSGTTSGSVVANGCSVATQSGTNTKTSLVMTAPTTLANGNVMVAQVITRTNVAITAPAGWTLISSQTNGTSLAQSLYYRVASSDTGGTTTWTWSVAAKADMSGGIVAFAGVDTTAPVDAVSTTGVAATGSPATAPSVTTTAPNDLVLAFYASQQGVGLAGSTYGGTATTKYYSAASKANPVANEADAAAAAAPSTQSAVGTTGVSTATLGSSQPWIAQTVALRPGGPTAVTLSGSRTKAGATSTWTAGFTATATGALAAGSTVTVTFNSAFTGIPASPSVVFGGSFAGCGATTGWTSGTVVTVTLPAGCSLANGATGTVAIAGVTNPAAATYTSTTFAVRTSADTADTSPSAGVTIAAATAPTAVTFAGSRTKAGAVATWTAGFTTTASGSLAAGDTVTIAFATAFTGIPASPSAVFGGAFAGCSSTTASASSAVVTVTLPAGCTIGSSAAGTITIAGVTNPAASTYANTTFAVHTSSDATDASPVSAVTVSAATTPTAVSFSGSSSVYGATATWTVGFTATANGSLAAGDRVVVTFDPAFTIPASPAVSFGGSFSGCAAGATGSKSGNVVTVTVPAGCSLADSAAGTLAIAGITNPVPTTYASTNFKVHTSSDAGDAGPVSGVTISKAVLTIGGAAASSKVYDATTAASVDFSGATLAGVVGSDVVTINSSGASASFATKAVGTAKAVTVTGVTLGGANAGNYTVSQPTSLTADITAKNLTVTGVTAANKTYDATTTATLNTGSAALAGVLAGDTVSLSTATANGSFADKTAATGKTVTITGLTLNGSDAANYALTQPTTTATIAAKNLTVTGITAANKTYDATTTATLNTGSAALAGVLAGDTVSLSTATANGSFADKTAATGKTVTITGLTLNGSDAANYTLTQPTTTATILVKSLTISGAVVNAKTYDGTTAATVDFSGASLVGVVSGDSVSIDAASSTATFATRNAGSGIGVTVTGVALASTDAADYTVAQPNGLTGTIAAKPLTVAGAVANDKVYTGTTAATVDFSGASLVGVVAGDSVSIDGSGATGTFASKDVAAGIAVTVAGIALGGTDALDYTVSQPSGLTASITPKGLTVGGAVAVGRIYDGTTAATVDFSGASLTGVVAGDAVTLDPSGYSAAFATRDAGAGIAVTVNGVGLAGASAGDYSLTQPAGLTATIATRSLTVTGAVANDKTYDGTAAATVDFTGAGLTGIVSGDTVALDPSAYSASFATRDAGAAIAVTVTGVTLTGANAADYTLFQPTGLIASITKKSLAVSGAVANDKTYDGTTAAALNLDSASLTGVVGGDLVSIDGSGATGTFATRHAGTAVPVTVTGLALSGADAAEYSLAQPSGLAADIAKRAITVSAQPDTKPYDTTTASSVTPQITSGSLATGDTASFTQSFDTAAVGTGKTLTPAGSVADGNSGDDYAVTFQTAAGTITAAAAAELVFGAAPAAATGGAAFGTQPEVSVADAYGNVVTSDSTTHVTLSIGTNPSGGSLTCPTSTTTVQVVNGVAAFAGCRIDKKGSGYTLTTTNDAGLANDTTAPFDVQAVATQLVVTSVNGGSDPTAGAGFSVTVEAQDAVGNPGAVGAATDVSLARAAGTGSLGGTTVGTIPAGQTSVTIAGVTYAKAEPGVSIVASRTGGDALSAGTSATFAVQPGAPTQLAITSAPATANTVSTFAVTIESQDALGNASPVAGDLPVALALASHSGGGAAGTLSGGADTLAGGQSSVTLSTVGYSRAEDITLQASATGLSGSLPSSTITVSPGPLAKLQLLVPGESAAPGTATGKTGTPAQQTATSAFPATVNAVDANWNLVASTHTIHLASSDAAATLPADTALAAGTATASVTMKTLGSGTQTLTASDTTDASVASSTSAPVPLAAGPVSGSQSSVTSTSPVVADGSTTGTVTVMLTDVGGNPVAGKTVTLAQNGGAHSTISAAPGPSDASGRVTFAVSDRTAEVVSYTAADATDSVTVAQTAQVSFEDHAPPTATIGAPASGADAAGSLTLTATNVADAGTGVAGVTFRYCDATADPGCDPAAGGSLAGADAGGQTWTASLDTTALLTGHAYSWLAVASDKGAPANTTATATRAFTVDNTLPTLAVLAPTLNTPAIEHWDGAATPNPTLWLNASGSGSFRLNASASDGETGVAKVTFPALLGTAAGDVTTGSPYQSGLYSFTNQGSGASGSIVATNGVTAGDGASTASASIDVAVDGSGPTAVLSSPLDGEIVASGVLLGATSDDGRGSGVAQVEFLYCDRTASPLCAPSIPIGTAASPTAGVYGVAWTTTGLTDGHAYAVAAVATDNVGNQTTSAVSTVSVDDSAPTVAMTAPTTSGDAYFDGTKLWLKTAGTGSYTLHATASDAQSGIASVLFGEDTGSGTGPYASPAYPFDGTSTPLTSSTATVTAANGVQLPAALTAGDQLQIAADGAAPTTAVQFPAAGGAYDPNSWPTGSQACTGTPTEGICGTVADTGAGVASVRLSLQDLSNGGKFYDGAAFAQAGQAPFLQATVSGGTWSYALDHLKLQTGTYELTVHGVDEVGNVETQQVLDFDYGTDLSPPDTALTLTSATHAYLASAGSHTSPNAGYDYVLYYSTAGPGAFTLHAASTDDSGIDHITFPSVFGTTGGAVAHPSGTSPWAVDSPAYSFGASDTTPPGQALVTSVDTRGNSGDDTIAFLRDDTAPSGGSVSVAQADANGYATTTSLTLSHVDFTDDVAGSGLASSALTYATASLTDGACGTFGPETPAGDGAFAATDGTCYRFTVTGTDRVGNVATATTVVKVDTTAPSTPAVVFGGLSAGNTYDDGAGTLWYRPSAGGTFTVTAAGAADAESGVKPGNAGYAFSSLLGGTQTGDQLAVTFGAGGVGSGAYTVHSTNRAGLDSGDASYSVDADSTPPVDGALKVNGTDAAASPTSSYLTAGTSIPIDARTDYTDAASGIATSTLTVETAPLAHDACGTFGGATTIGGTSSQSAGNATCYRFTLTGTDRVGNVASVSTVVKVDTTPPVTPSIVFSGLSAGNTYDDGAGTLWYRPSAGGAFTVTAAGAADPETDVRSGDAGYTFSPLNGFLTAAQTGSRVDVTFDAGSTGSGSYGVVATNNAGVASAPASFTVAADGAGPANGLLSIDPYSPSQAVSIGEQDFADAGSGIASNVLTRSAPQAPAGGSCPAGGYTGATAVAVAGGAASDTVPTDGQCYEYTLTGTDRVGNVSAYTTIVLVDSTPPAGGSVQAPDGTVSLDRISVDWDAGADVESGIATVDLQRADAPVSGSTCGGFGGFTTVAANVGVDPFVDSGVSAGNCYRYRIVVTNHAGVSATFASSAVTQLTDASPIDVATSAGATHLGGTTLWLGPGATTFGLGLTGVGANGVTSADWSASAGSLSGAAATATTGSFPSSTYTWDGTTPLSTSIAVTRQPSGTVDSLEVKSDTTPPAGSILYADGVAASHSVPVSTSGVSDGESGVDGVQILRSETTLTGSTCDPAWSSFQPVTTSGGNDTSVEDAHCYRYEAVVTDNVGNSRTATSSNVVQIPDITPPTFVSGATDLTGARLTIAMSEPLDAASVPAAGRFVVYYDGTAQPTPTSVALAGSDVVLGLASPPDDAQTVTVRYASDGSLRDTAAPTQNATASFGPAAVTNNTPDTVAPSPSSAGVDRTTLTLRLDEDLAGAAPAPPAFDVTVNGKPRAVTGVSIGGKSVTLTLAPAVENGDVVLLAYSVPALDGLHDASGNAVAGFTTSVTNATAVVAPPVAPPAPTPPATARASAPALLAARPADGATVAAADALTLTADRPVTWTRMTLRRPGGGVQALPDATGATAAWTPGTAASGLYVLRGTIAADGLTTTIVSHFTIWPASGTAPPPAVEKNAGGSPDSVTSADGSVTAGWTAGAFGVDPVVVRIVPQAPAAVSLPAGSLVVDVTAFLRDSHTPVRKLDGVVDVQFRNAPPDASPRMSQDARTWSGIAQLPTLQLPAGQTEGWFRDSDGTVHVLTRHLTYYALLLPQAETQLVLRIVTPRRLWLAGRTFMAVRILVNAPARVTGSFVAEDGTVVPGQVIATPTRRAGSTLLRVPLHVAGPGLYRLQVHAEGIGQAVDRTARIRFLAKRPASPVWQTGRLGVAVVAGARIDRASLRSALGPAYAVRTVSDADLYSAVDPSDPRAAAAVVVDLGTVPLPSLRSLHVLLPELRIVGVTSDRSLAQAARAAGVGVVEVRRASPAVTHRIKSLLPVR